MNERGSCITYPLSSPSHDGSRWEYHPRSAKRMRSTASRWFLAQFFILVRPFAAWTTSCVCGAVDPLAGLFCCSSDDEANFGKTELWPKKRSARSYHRRKMSYFLRPVLFYTSCVICVCVFVQESTNCLRFPCPLDAWSCPHRLSNHWQIKYIKCPSRLSVGSKIW